MSVPGGNSWDTAAPLPVGDTSTNSLTGVPDGADFPYQSAWWVVTPDVDLQLILDSELSLDTAGDPVDTDLIVYTGPDYASATQVAADNDSGSAIFTSKLDVTLSAGVTYHVRLGTYGGISGTLVLRSTQWVWSAWTQDPAVERTATAATKEVIDGVAQYLVTGGATFSSTLASQALSSAFVASGTWHAADLSDQRLGPRINGSNYFQSSFRYNGQAPYVTGRLALGAPQNSFGLNDFTTPPGGFGLELASTEGTVTGSGVAYSLQEGAYHTGQNFGGTAQPLLGTWSYTLTTPNNSVTVAGGVGHAPGDEVASGKLPISLDPAANTLVTATLSFSSATIPANNTDGFTDSYSVGADWTCSTYLTILPPLYRYKMAVGSEPPATGTLHVPPLRLYPREDGRGMSSAARVFPPPRISRYGRIGPGSVL